MTKDILKKYSIKELAKRFALICGIALTLLIMTGCGGPNVCDCKTEAAKENPDREFMADCEELYKGKSYEEIEAELEQCVK